MQLGAQQGGLLPSPYERERNRKAQRAGNTLLFLPASRSFALDISLPPSLDISLPPSLDISPPLLISLPLSLDQQEMLPASAVLLVAAVAMLASLTVRSVHLPVYPFVPPPIVAIPEQTAAPFVIRRLAQGSCGVASCTPRDMERSVTPDCAQVS